MEACMWLPGFDERSCYMFIHIRAFTTFTRYHTENWEHKLEWRCNKDDRTYSILHSRWTRRWRIFVSISIIYVSPHTLVFENTCGEDNYILFSYSLAHVYVFCSNISCMWFDLYESIFWLARETGSLLFILAFCENVLLTFGLLSCYRTTFSWFLFLGYPFKQMMEANILLGLLFSLLYSSCYLSD
jgi:hypothetical protein